MAQGTLIITDDGDTGLVTVSVDYGDAVVADSKAHALISYVLENILGAAQSYTKVEDSAPGEVVEPSRIELLTN